MRSLLVLLLLCWAAQADAASRFWVGGTGTWDSSTTTHWAATTGGAGGQSVPTSADTVTFDGSSGGGTVTVNFGGTITVTSITCGAFTGTLDFSANNNSVTLSGNGFNCSGTGTRTLNLGNGTWKITGTLAASLWNMGTTTGLTFAANSSTIEFSAVTANTRTFAGGGLTYSGLLVDANTSSGSLSITGANTFSSVTVTGMNNFQLQASTTQTATTLSLSGTSGSEIGVFSGSQGTQATISVASGSPTMTYLALRDIACAGGATFTASNSFSLGDNTGVTINAPGSGGGFIIGGL